MLAPFLSVCHLGFKLSWDGIIMPQMHSSYTGVSLLLCRLESLQVVQQPHAGTSVGAVHLQSTVLQFGGSSSRGMKSGYEKRGEVGAESLRHGEGKRDTDCTPYVLQFVVSLATFGLTPCCCVHVRVCVIV